MKSIYLKLNYIGYIATTIAGMMVAYSLSKKHQPGIHFTAFSFFLLLNYFYLDNKQKIYRAFDESEYSVNESPKN